MYVMSFLIFMLCFVLTCILLYRVTIGSESFMLRSYEKSGYSQLTAGDMYEDLNLSAEISGISDENYFESIVPEELLRESIDGFFAQSIAGESPKADTSEFEVLVENGINEYIERSGGNVEDDEELRENVDAFVDESSRTFRQWVELRFLPEAGKILRLFDTPANTGIAIMAVLICIVVFIAYKTLRNREALFDACIIAVSGVFVFLTVCIVYVYAADLAGRIGIGSFALYSLVTEVIQGVMSSAIVIDAILAAVIVSLILLRHFLGRGRRRSVEAEAISGEQDK